MTPVPAFAFPPGRTLAGWWRQLVPFHPQQLAVAHLLIHRVEALAAVERTVQTDRFAGLVLRALALAPEGTLTAVDRQLGLGPAATHRALLRLGSEGLTDSTAPDCWRPSPLGTQALEKGSFTRLERQRRAFLFYEHSQDGKPPHYLPLHADGDAWRPDENWRFDVGLLTECINQNAEWKKTFGFPLEVSALARIPAEDWQRVIVDTAEHHVLALVTPAGAQAPPRLLGFAVRAENWTLHADRPVLTLEEGWQELFPAVAAGLDNESGRSAWLAWCRQHALPPADAEACVIQPHGSRLTVHAPQRLIERIRADRGEATWVLAGDNFVQIAARIELTSAPPPKPAAVAPR
jgi:hypothetical protein